MDGRLAAIEAKVDGLVQDVASVKITIARIEGAVGTSAAKMDGRIDATTATLIGKIDAMGARLEGRIDTLTERVAHLPTKGFMVSAVLAALALTGGMITLQGQIQAALGVGP